MRGKDGGDENQFDLWQPETQPTPAEKVDADQATAGELPPQEGTTYLLTGWRGAGWHMIFPDPPKESDEPEVAE